MLSLELFLFLYTLTAAKSISDSIVVGLDEQARVVLKSDRHVRAQFWHFEEMNSGLSDNLLDENVRQIIGLDNIAFFVNLILEDIKGQTTTLVEDLIDQELMLRVGVREVDLLFSTILDVSLIIVTIVDCLLRCDQFSNVDSGRVSVLLQVICQLLHVVR